MVAVIVIHLLSERFIGNRSVTARLHWFLQEDFRAPLTGDEHNLYGSSDESSEMFFC